MFKNLRKKALVKTINKHLKKRDVSRRNDRLKTIAFLVDEESYKKQDALISVASSLGVSASDIHFFSFVTFHKKAPSLLHNQIHHKQYSWSGTVKNKEAKEFLKRDFDVLIGYYSKENILMDILTAMSNSKFKVGINRFENELFDLSLLIKLGDTKMLQQEVKKYFKILGKI